jgi:hypothetical protein
MPEPESGFDQMFPSLSPGEIDGLRRFGAIGRYATAEPVVTAASDPRRPGRWTRQPVPPRFSKSMTMDSQTR